MDYRSRFSDRVPSRELSNKKGRDMKCLKTHFCYVCLPGATSVDYRSRLSDRMPNRELSS